MTAPDQRGGGYHARVSLAGKSGAYYLIPAWGWWRDSDGNAIACLSHFALRGGARWGWHAPADAAVFGREWDAHAAAAACLREFAPVGVRGIALSPVGANAGQDADWWYCGDSGGRWEHAGESDVQDFLREQREGVAA